MHRFMGAGVPQDPPLCSSMHLLGIQGKDQVEVGDEQQLETGQGEAQNKGEGPGGGNEDDHQLAEEKGDGHEELAR